MARLMAAGISCLAAGTGAGCAVRLGADALLVTTGQGSDRLELRHESVPAPAPGLAPPASPSEPGSGRPARAEHSLLAVGAATVDPDRFAAEHALDPPEAAGEDAALGARAWSTTGLGGRLVLLEPSTEGRLAGFLARAGEGMAVLYLQPARSTGRKASPATFHTGDRSTAPWGRQGWTVIRGQPSGPYLVLVDRDP